MASNVLTDAICNGFINDAEFRILRDVDSDNNRRYKTANLVASTRFIQTPDDCLVIRSAQILDSDGVASANNRDFYNIEIPISCQNLILRKQQGCQNIIVGGIKTILFLRLSQMRLMKFN